MNILCKIFTEKKTEVKPAHNRHKSIKTYKGMQGFSFKGQVAMKNIYNKKANCY